MLDLGSALLQLARGAIGQGFGQPPPAPPAGPPELAAPGASFVTLTQGGDLRGCIGTLAAYRPLADDVRQNALAAAFHDPRFKPLTAAELPRTRVEVSRLHPPQALPFAGPAEALAQLRPGVDGIVLSAGRRRATFLPQVWEQLPDPAEFLARLKLKAGLPGDYWGDDLRLERYTVDQWQEPPP